METDMSSEISRLRAEIERHNHLYYDQATPEISDREYDALYRRLAELEAEEPETPLETSPPEVVVEESPPKTPDQTVAESIVSGLLASKLITSDSAKGLASKIVAGKVSASDWSVMIKFGATAPKDESTETH